VRDRSGDVNRDSRDRLVEGAGDDEVCGVAGRLMLWKLLSRGQMGDGSYAKSLALTWVGLKKPCIRQEMLVIWNSGTPNLFVHKTARESGCYALSLDYICWGSHMFTPQELEVLIARV
jgi:hypothetical protein